MKNKTLIFITLLAASIVSIILIFNTKTETREEKDNVEKVQATVDKEELKKCDALLEKLDSINLSHEWKLLKCGLWQNKHGDIGFKTSSVVCREGLDISDTYIKRIGNNENPPLKDIIDTATFRELGNTYYKDKNHIYRHYRMSGGGFFHIFEDADYETFQILGDCYAKDKNHIFESRAGILENVDYTTFKTKSGLTGCVAKDKNGFLIWGDRVNKNELKDEYLKKSIEELKK